MSIVVPVPVVRFVRFAFRLAVHQPGWSRLSASRLLPPPPPCRVVARFSPRARGRGAPPRHAKRERKKLWVLSEVVRSKILLRSFLFYFIFNGVCRLSSPSPSPSFVSFVSRFASRCISRGGPASPRLASCPLPPFAVMSLASRRALAGGAPRRCCEAWQGRSLPPPRPGGGSPRRVPGGQVERRRSWGPSLLPPTPPRCSPASPPPARRGGPLVLASPSRTQYGGRTAARRRHPAAARRTARLRRAAPTQGASDRDGAGARRLAVAAAHDLLPVFSTSVARFALGR